MSPRENYFSSQTKPAFLTAISLTHAVPALIIFAAILDFSFLGSYLPVALWKGPWGGILLLFVGISKVYLLSGILGSLLELVSGEHVLLSLTRLHRNAQRFWRISLLFYVVPSLLHFLIFAVLPQQKIPLEQITVYGNILFSGLLAQVLVRSKYVRPLGLGRRKIPVFLPDAIFLVAVTLGNIAVYQLVLGIDRPGLNLHRVALVFFQYMHILVFVHVARMILDQYPEIQKQYAAAKELYLVNPAGSGVLWAMAMIAMRSLPPWFTVLKALTPNTYRIREFNRVFWRDRSYAAGKLVAVSCCTANSAEAYKIAKEFKRRGSTVIMGGPHVTVFPEEALEFCDSVIVGEAEGVWAQVVRDYENQELKKQYFPREDLQALARVQEFLLQSPPAVIKEFIETTRGCKYHCYFCSIPNSGIGCLRKKPVSDVVALVKKIKQQYSHFVLIDNNIYSDPGYTRGLLEALRPLRVRWSASSSVDIAQNEEILCLAKQAGCQMLLLGYEIADDSPEQAQGGKFSVAQKYLELSRKIQKAGIGIKAHFIVGFDSQDLRGLWQLWVFCLRLRPFLTVTSILTPLPGSQCFDDLLRQGRITTLNWRNYNCQKLVFRPKRIPAWVLAQPIYAGVFFGLLATTSTGGLLILGLLAALVGWGIWG